MSCVLDPGQLPIMGAWSKEQFKKLFPHDAFGNEHDANNWEKGKMVWETEFDTEKATEIELGNMKNWASGKYVIELQDQRQVRTNRKGYRANYTIQ